MRKFNYVCSLILAVMLPLMIVILSSNLVLRVSEIYVFHFNDSQVINEIPYNVTGSQMAKEISSYWSSFSGEAFQVEEDNGDYQDPIFEPDEQRVMGKVKNILNIELAAGLFCLAVTLAIYIYLLRNGYREALRNRYRAGAALSALLLVAQGVCWSLKSFRVRVYDFFVGIELSEDSQTLVTILGDSFFRTYILFASLFGAALLAVLTYAHYHLTKPERIFY